MVYPKPPLYPLNDTIVTVTTVPFAIVQVAAAATAPASGLPPEKLTVGGVVSVSYTHLTLPTM